MAASEKVSGRPGRPLRGANHSISRSSQTSREPRFRSAALYAALYSDQFVVRWRADGGLLMPAQISGQTLHVRPPRGRCATTPL